MLTVFDKSPSSLGTLHFIGIGGIGMSGLAEYLHEAGFSVQGSDTSVNGNIQRLQSKGVNIFGGHHPNNIDKAFRVVVSTAIKGDNPELLEAKKRGIRVVHRSEILAELVRQGKGVAVTGTHGKTTTTSMIFHVLGYGGTNPSIVTGGIIRGIQTNAVLGAGEWFVAEADESDGSFTRFHSHIGVITNMDAEHMDHYASVDSMRESFMTFLKNIHKGGSAVLCADHPETKKMASLYSGRRVVTYGFDESADVRPFNVRQNGDRMLFDLDVMGEGYQDILLHAPGEHNVQNACAAVAVGLLARLPMDSIREGLSKYRGVRRRFQKLAEVDGVTVIDDYAHHPVEVAATLKAARAAYETARIIAVIQPHRYSRLQELMQDFAKSIEHADEVLLAPVYAAGESEIDGVNHEALAIAMAGEFEGPVNMISDEKDMINHVKDHSQRGDVILCMGAGSISQWAHGLVKALNE